MRVVFLLVLTADDTATPLQGSLWRWVERNGWWAAFAVIWAVGGVVWGWRHDLRDWWRDRDSESVYWAVGGAVVALVAAILGALL